MNQKKIGIIGGVGPQASILLYEKVIKIAQSKYGAKNNDDFPYVIIESVPVPDFISNTNEIKQAKEMLLASTESLIKAGATKLCIGSNTVHLLLDDLQSRTKVPFISIPHEVSNHCSRDNIRLAGLLGSPVTLNSNIYDKEFSKHGIDIIKPDKKNQRIIDQMIRDVLEGKECRNTEEYITILNEMVNKGAQKIILGCTELPLAINYEALGTRIINTIDLLAESLVDYYYEDEE